MIIGNLQEKGKGWIMSSVKIERRFAILEKRILELERGLAALKSLLEVSTGYSYKALYGNGEEIDEDYEM